MYKEIKKCLICGGSLVPILHLGNQNLTGVFPRSKGQKITSGPLELVKCFNDKRETSCGLVQLSHSYDLKEMYGHNYGYRSGLNQSMVNHLHNKVDMIQNLINLNRDDLIIDIGSNDGTLLQAYPKQGFVLAGIDPTGEKFREYYPRHVQLISDFFSTEVVKRYFGTKKAKVVTSISMFYDLESPIDFMKQVHDVLADDGIWVFEQSYMPTMLAMNAYDTICHEHLEYYCLKQIKWMTDRLGFKIVDVEFNNVNGGSFSVIAAKSNSSYTENTSLVRKILFEEENKGFDSLNPFEDFRQKVYSHREELIQFVQRAKFENKKVLGYGASTKGNVILQFCNFTENDIPFIAEVNSDKFGCYTPGTFIPIISEEEARLMRPDYFLVLPWHFKEGIIKREKKFLSEGGRLVMPLPEIEIIKYL